MFVIVIIDFTLCIDFMQTQSRGRITHLIKCWRLVVKIYLTIGTGRASITGMNSLTPETVAKPAFEEILSYEAGELSDEETLIFFQKLVDSGLAWTLQGSYGRMAKNLQDQGLIH